ncbi:unnamed protein product [Mytilus coruscus]|uniref:Uncharacterized protein n=1 Tax=Mytilus coruscus TaxID=42192 RepID=A0A6J8B643_MYTCO|nr:unnamed protein product [Mytilus coruscus]
MGATFAKLDCSGCFRKNKIGVVTNSQHSITHRFETRPSSVIIQELQRIGIVSERSGGVKFFVETSTESDKTNEKPRRLPALPGSSGLTRGRRTEKSRATTSKENDIHIYDKEEKGLMVEIRRIGALADKGKMAKESAKRRQEVIARKETRLKEKIQKIENKLKRENQTAQKNITKPSKENRPKPERKPRSNKPSVSGLPSVSV